MGKDRHKIAFVGCVEAGFFCAERLIEGGIVPAAIVSIDSVAAGRHQVSGYKDLFTLPADCERYRPASYALKDTADEAFFQNRQFDMFLVLGWQRLIPASIIKTLKVCGLTVHGSGEGLPKGRGRSPMNWAIIKGFDRFYLSLLTLSPEADGGKIVGTRQFDILPADTIRTMYHKNAFFASLLMLEHIPKILAGKASLVDQDESQATYYPKRNPEDGRINWKDEAVTVERLVRAVTRPYPGAFTFSAGNRMMIWQARLFDRNIKGKEAPGTVTAVFPDGAFLVKSADYYVLVTEYEGSAPHQGEILT